MPERRKQYPFDKIETKWQSHWDQQETFKSLNPGDEGFDPEMPKFYALDMMLGVLFSVDQNSYSVT